MAAWSGEDFSPRSGGVVWHSLVRPKVGARECQRAETPGFIPGSGFIPTYNIESTRYAANTISRQEFETGAHRRRIVALPEKEIFCQTGHSVVTEEI